MYGLVPQPVRLCQNFSELVRTCPDCSERVRACQDLSEFDQTVPGVSERARVCPDSPGRVRRCTTNPGLHCTRPGVSELARARQVAGRGGTVCRKCSRAKDPPPHGSIGRATCVRLPRGGRVVSDAANRNNAVDVTAVSPTKNHVGRAACGYLEKRVSWDAYQWLR